MNEMIAIMGLSGGELILIFAVILILFGAKKIPEFAKGLGSGMKEFKKASREISDELQAAVDVDSEPPRRATPKSIPHEPLSDRTAPQSDAAPLPQDSSPSSKS